MPVQIPLAAEFSTSDGHLTGAGQATITVYGAKGDGKTGTALGLPGTKFAISYDRKTGRIHDGMYKNSPDIIVRDGKAFYNETPMDLTASAVKTYRWIEYLLEKEAPVAFNGGRPDWIVHDFVPKLAEICEMKMRRENNLKAFEGFKNLVLWKERNLHVRNIHNKSLAVARKGVVYTAYVDVDRKKSQVVDGEIFNSVKKPSYDDIVEQETDIVLYQYVSQPDITKPTAYMIHVDSNKLRQDLWPLKSGETIDITGKTLGDILKFRGAKVLETETAGVVSSG